MVTDDGTWIKWSRHVLEELKRLNKWCGEIDKKLDNHVTTIEHRLTKIETNQRTSNKIYYIVITAVLSIFAMVFALLVN